MLTSFFFFILFRFSKQGKRLSATNKGEYNLNAIKMLEMNLKIIGNDIKAEINEGWGNIRLRMTLKINVG